MEFKTIDIKKHREKVIEFRKDSFRVSFGMLQVLKKKIILIGWIKRLRNFQRVLF